MYDNFLFHFFCNASRANLNHEYAADHCRVHPSLLPTGKPIRVESNTKFLADLRKLGKHFVPFPVPPFANLAKVPPNLITLRDIPVHQDDSHSMDIDV